MTLTIFNDQFQLFAYSWTAGIFGAAAFATFGPLLERGIDALQQWWRKEGRVRDLGAMSDDWQPRWPRRPR